MPSHPSTQHGDFASLGLAPALCRAAAEQGFDSPSPIQGLAIPAALRGGDLLVRAQTGSGKTAAYALPLLQQLLRADPAPAPRSGRRRTRILVLVPTRELAQQVGEFMRNLARVLDSAPRIAVVFGGVSINPQMMGLRGGAEVVVATPGRLLDLVDQNALQINALDRLVLDEADRLLGLGFADELGRILALLPRRQQTLLFSATFTPEVQQCADALLHEPERILMDAAATEAPDIVQRAIAVDESRRTQLLRHLVETEQWPQVLVFVATKYATELVAHKLVRAGIHAASLHGDLAQGTRTDVLQAFKDKEARVLIATDVAARGIDIARLPVVVNYDLPRATADYLHRIGRTGRAGESGLALSFVTAAQEAHFRLIEKRQQQRVPREVVTGFEPTEQARAEQLAGGVKGKRKSKKDKLREAAALAKDDASASKR